MRKSLACLAALLVVASANAFAYGGQEILPAEQAAVGTPSSDVPLRAVQTPGRPASDTICWGYVDADGYAILGEVWTFDHYYPPDCDLEGWTSIDVTGRN